LFRCRTAFLWLCNRGNYPSLRVQHFRGRHPDICTKAKWPPFDSLLEEPKKLLTPIGFSGSTQATRYEMYQVCQFVRKFARQNNPVAPAADWLAIAPVDNCQSRQVMPRTREQQPLPAMRGTRRGASSLDSFREWNQKMDPALDFPVAGYDRKLP